MVFVKSISRLGGALAVGVFMMACAVHAAPGYNVTVDQVDQIRQGMSMSEVESKLGRPYSKLRYPTDAGYTFSYHLVKTSPSRFDIAFDAHGNVKSTSTYAEMDHAGI